MAAGMLLWVDAAKLCALTPKAYAPYRETNRQFSRWLILRCLNIKTPGDYPLWLQNFLQALGSVRDRRELPFEDFRAAMKLEIPHAVAHYLMDGSHRIRERPPVVWQSLSKFLNHSLIAPCFEGDGPEITRGLLVRAYASARAGDLQDASDCLERTKDAELPPEWESARLAAKLRVLAGGGDGEKAIQMARSLMGRPVLSPSFGQVLAFLGEAGSLPEASQLLAEGHYRALLEGPGTTFMLDDFVERVGQHRELRGLVPWLLRLYVAEMACGRSPEEDAEGTEGTDATVNRRITSLATLINQVGLDAQEALKFKCYLVIGPSGPDGQLQTPDDQETVWHGRLSNWPPPIKLVELARKQNRGTAQLCRVSTTFHEGKCDDALGLLDPAERSGSPDSPRKLARLRCLVSVFKNGYLPAPACGDKAAASPGDETLVSESRKRTDTAGLTDEADGAAEAYLLLIQHLFQSAGSLGEDTTLGLVRRVMLVGLPSHRSWARNLDCSWNALARIYATEGCERRADRLFALMDDRFQAGYRLSVSLWLASRLLQEGNYDAADRRARDVEEHSRSSEQLAEARAVRIMAAGSQGKFEEGLVLAKDAHAWQSGSLGRSRIGVAAGWLCLQSGDIVQARKHLSEAAAIKPSNVYARRASQMLERLGAVSAERQGE
ncbi:MAG: hypothetical protein JXQ73_28755 [Phycisphaerae bacterium]|nr:hypothetical protein [Phycisphaerae bacterium]